MKPIRIILFLIFISSIAIIACKKGNIINPEDTISGSIAPISKLTATATTEKNELELSWTNPDDEALMKVEISYKPNAASASATPNPILLSVTKGTQTKYKIIVPSGARHTITVVAINKAGAKSTAVTVDATPFTPGTIDTTPLFLKRADSLMTSLVNLYLTGKSMDIWTSTYPKSDGFWDGAAVIWGHGGAFSGYAALKEAAKGVPSFKAKYETLYDTRLLNAIDKFRNTKNGKAEAYAVYPGTGDERFYDDNIWVGIDMVDLYMLTKNPVYLNRARMVWTFILEGTDDKMGGGVYWKEYGSSKNTCSTAPAAVLSAKLYQATKEDAFLNSAKNLYAWCKNVLQDPTDKLYWDNVTLSDPANPSSALKIAKEKYPYNSGQPMQAASLLYNITGERQYLTEAQAIAKSAYKKWFIPFNSYILGESFQILEPGHVWFQAIMFRGFIELYKIDGDRTYVTAYEKTLSNAWLSSCRNKGTNLLNGDFRGGTVETKWDILHQGACLEMLARLAALEHDQL